MAESAETEEAVAEAPTAKLGLVQILMIVVLVIVTQIVMKVVLDTFFPPQVVAESAEDARGALVDEDVAGEVDAGGRGRGPALLVPPFELQQPRACDRKPDLRHSIRRCWQLAERREHGHSLRRKLHFDAV